MSDSITHEALAILHKLQCDVTELKAALALWREESRERGRLVEEFTNELRRREHEDDWWKRGPEEPTG